ELPLEPLLLVYRVVELRKGVRDFPSRYVKLESVGKLGICLVLPRERRHIERKAVDECRAYEVPLVERLEYLDDGLPPDALGIKAHGAGLLEELRVVDDDILPELLCEG